MTLMSARCTHDMLPGTCSWCLGQPDVPELDELFLETARRHIADSSGRSKYQGSSNVMVKPADHCTNCDADITGDDQATWSPTYGGLVGPCCEESA